MVKFRDGITSTNPSLAQIKQRSRRSAGRGRATDDRAVARWSAPTGLQVQRWSVAE
ncbi:hypothetical protein [Streptomyces sp. NBC_00286]|uniref:hypothetical protein n=1 Tax=Streptomyces sp. NBC_00286 TaxID=2975701 RepID=UPI002E2A0BE5|nr:hypothetical protein [Streptomyces sp. NBC_00286]